MDRLYTPWRRQFIEAAASGTSGPCFLCGLPSADPRHDRDNLLLHRGERTFVAMNRYPYNSGHLLVAPYQHTGDFAGLDPVVAADLMALTQRCVAVLQHTYHPDAFNVGLNLGGAAGAGVPDHLHVHVVPRWNGDTNFMPIVADTKVLPESLDQTYERLLAGLS